MAAAATEVDPPTVKAHLQGMIVETYGLLLRCASVFGNGSWEQVARCRNAAEGAPTTSDRIAFRGDRLRIFPRDSAADGAGLSQLPLNSEAEGRLGPRAVRVAE